MFTVYDKKYCFHFTSTTKLQSWVKHFDAKFTPPWLTLSWRRPLSYRNQSIDLLSKSMDWLLCDNGLRHERVKRKIFFISALRSLRHGNKAMATGKRNLILIEPLLWERSIKGKNMLIYCYVHYTMIKTKYYFSFYHFVHHVYIILHLPATLTTSVILWKSLQTIPSLTNICVTYQEFQWSFKI